MSKTLQIGLVGGGMIAQAHMRNFSTDSRTTVRWLAEPNEAARSRSQETFKIPHVTASYRDLLADPELDAVVVCTPPSSHVEIGVATLRAGKHLLMEKPLSLNATQARVLLDEAKVHPHVKVSGCSARHARLNPKFAVVRRMIAEGQLGRVYHIHHRALSRQGRGGIEYNPNAKWFLDRTIAGGGPLFDWGVYDLSFHLGVVGEPALVQADGFCINGLDRVAHGAPTFTVEEHGGALMTFAGGLKYYWERANNSHVDVPNQTTILGTQGGLRFGYCTWDKPQLEFFDVGDDGTGKARVRTIDVDMSSHVDDMHALGQAFIAFLRDEGPAPMSLATEVTNLTILDRVYQAANW